MRRILLASTALLALATVPARAEMEVTVGGFTAFQAGFFDNDNANSSDRDFQSEAKIFVHADGVADNGLEYGAKVILESSTSDTNNAQETTVYAAGSWGRVELGDQPQAGRRLEVFAPTVGAGQINGSYDDFVPSADRGHVLNDRGDAGFLAMDSVRDTNITYFTPKFAGFQAGVTYTPELGSKGEDVEFSDTANTRNHIALGLHYEGEFSGVGVKAGGQYNMADAQPGTEDISTWGLGLQLSYMGFTFGGSYDDQGDSLSPTGTANDDIQGFDLGATYESGPWGVGISYLNTDFDTNGVASMGNDGNGGEYTAWVIGGTYKVAPGLTTSADLAFYDRNRAAGADTDGFVALVDVTAAF